MSNQLKIGASILASDFGRMADEIRDVVAGGIDFIHFDCMDGHFVPNITIGPPVAAALRRYSTVPIHSHLMITNPNEYARTFVDAGSETVGIHIETHVHHHHILRAIKEAGAQACIVLNPGTSPDAIRYLVDSIDEVLVMTVNPGFGGQEFIPEMLDKIREVRDMIGPEKDISVDGGINDETARQVAEAGANVLIAGTAIFKADNYAEVISRLRESAKSGRNPEGSGK
ncbi:MAG: ribulose-phosphate 3-epimerase [Candidatus Hydrogenedentes bacterium]|nr:ribulose-phosphate 3-epimerase [Candidatus Hydrogenedentota bacterium]